jgi:hypothetical protein
MGEEEGIAVVRQGQHQGEIGHRQQCSCAVLAPLALRKRLALWAVTRATGVVRVPLKPTGGTVFGMAATLRGTAGLEGSHHLLMCGRHEMGTAVCLAGEADDIGDVPPGGAGLALCCCWGAGGGGRRHGVTPVEAGPWPRRAGGRTGGGSSPEAAG